MRVLDEEQSATCASAVRYAWLLARKHCAILRRQDLFEEAYSQALWSLVSAAGAYDHTVGAFTTYATVSIRRHLWAWSRKKARECAREAALTFDPSEPQPKDQPRSSRAEWLDSLLGLIPAEEAQAIRMTSLSGRRRRSYGSVADSLGLTWQEVRSRRRKGIRRLRALIGSHNLASQKGD